MLEEQQANNIATKKIRLIEDNLFQVHPRQAKNQNIRFLTKEEAEKMREPKVVAQQNKQLELPKTLLPFTFQFPLPISNPNQKDQRSRSRSPRKENGRLSLEEIDQYTLQILKAFQTADERRRQLQNRNI